MHATLKLFAIPSLLFATTFACGTKSGGSADGAMGGAGGTPVVGTGSTGAGTGGAAAAGGSSNGSGGSSTNKPGNRVVGYAATWQGLDPTTMDLDTLTHLNVAFANPSGGASIVIDATDDEINTLISAAHAKNVKVLFSIAGAAGGADVMAKASAGVDAYAADLVAYLNKFSFDGIDVDVEGDNVKNASYHPMVAALKAALPAGKLLTAAVANYNGSDFKDETLALYDFINVMSYDHGWPWDTPADHSSYADAVSEVGYWETTRGLSADKVVLGVPFYGYCWGSDCPGQTVAYWKLLEMDADSKTTDMVVKPNHTFSLNCPDTIGKKADFAKMHGGIMIWELGQDALGADALMATIKAHQ